MLQNKILFSLLIGIFLMSLVSAWSNSFLQENIVCTNSIDGTTDETDNTVKNISQTFIPSSDISLNAINLRLMKFGSIGNVNVELKATDGSGFPTGSALNSTIISPSLISSYPTWAWIKINLSYTLTSGVKYAIVLSPTTSDGYNSLMMNINNDCGISGNSQYWDGSWNDISSYDSYLVLEGTQRISENLTFPQQLINNITLVGFT